MKIEMYKFVSAKLGRDIEKQSFGVFDLPVKKINNRLVVRFNINKVTGWPVEGNCQMSFDAQTLEMLPTNKYMLRKGIWATILETKD